VVEIPPHQLKVKVQVQWLLMASREKNCRNIIKMSLWHLHSGEILPYHPKVNGSSQVGADGFKRGNL
jgi:hypothetical protein